MGRRMRTLVTGAGGQLGIDYVAHAVARGDEVLALTRSQLDVADRDAVLGVITPWRPDVVVNAAAWTAVDAARPSRTRPSRQRAAVRCSPRL